jgi:hypothetical protein
MVFMQASDTTSIVLDGQQRLATSIMILAAVRTWLSQFTEYKEAARQIQERFIGLAELGETQVQPRLHLNTANHALFERYVINERPITEIQTALVITWVRPSADYWSSLRQLSFSSTIQPDCEVALNSKNSRDLGGRPLPPEHVPRYLDHRR